VGARVSVCALTTTLSTHRRRWGCASHTNRHLHLRCCTPQLTHNSYQLRFELPGGASASMPVASCLLTKTTMQGPGDDKPKVVGVCAVWCCQLRVVCVCACVCVGGGGVSCCC
jgi:hypothetical protein